MEIAMKKLRLVLLFTVLGRKHERLIRPSVWGVRKDPDAVVGLRRGTT